MGELDGARDVRDAASGSSGCVIGVDIGGTFTDTVVVFETGAIAVGKALSTPERVEDGVMASLRAAAADAGVVVGDLLSTAAVIAHGTTVGLNALLTASGARVGLLTTAGFEATLPIAKANKIHGLREDEQTRPSRWRKPDLLVPRALIKPIIERIDVTGSVVVPLDETAARRTIRELGSAGVEAVAIALLWSVASPVHERRLAELVREELGDIHVSVSSELAPRLGEYERTSTVVVDAYVAPLVSTYLRRLESRLRGAWFAGDLLVLRMGGGVQRASDAIRWPVHTVHSGPVGGLAASCRLGAELGQRSVISTDVGGTSFDVGLIIAGETQLAARPMLDRHALAVPVVDVTSIGTGGGSLAWFDKQLGALRVGPASAGADPGPACYCRGGVRPTLTDAAAVLGYVVRLGRGLTLDVAAARRAIAAELAEPMGLTVEEAADGVLRVATAQMRDLIRRTTVQRGHDPRQFALYAFGGAGPQYVAWYAAELGVRHVVVPALAPELSAFGAATSDLVVTVTRDLAPRPIAECIDTLVAVAGELDSEVEARLAGPTGTLVERLGTQARREWHIGLRFGGQQRRIDVPLPPGCVGVGALEACTTAFHERYERLVGPGTAVRTAIVEAVAVTASVAVPLPAHARAPLPREPSVPRGTRTAWFDGSLLEAPVHWWPDLAAGQECKGPAFVESEQTTVVVPPGCRAHVDAIGNIELELP